MHSHAHETFWPEIRLYYEKRVSLCRFNMDLSDVQLHILLYNGTNPGSVGWKRP